MYNSCCSLLLYGKMKIYAPTFYIINWQWVYVFVFMCVCTLLNSTRLNSTRLAHESAALSVSHARYSVFKQRSETMNAWWAKGGGGVWTGGGRWATSTRSPFPRGLKLIITFFTHNFTLHWCVTWGDVLMGGTSYSTGSMQSAQESVRGVQGAWWLLAGGVSRASIKAQLCV